MPKLTIEKELIVAGYSLFKAATNKERLRMLRYLHRKGESKVKDVYKALSLEQSRTSGHLAILRRYGLVHSRRAGKEIYYSVNYERLEEVGNGAVQVVGK